jgi:hypothetical protein
MSLSVEALQFESAAPKRLPRVSPPVEEALPKDKTPDDRLVDNRLDTVVVASVVIPEMVSAVADALESVVFPVTVRVEEKTPVVPVIAPSVATVE